MPSSLAAETVLQGRYRLLKLMAEGGFARTYLAEDQGRFGECCVVKEFCPNSSDATVFEKANELFQREAQTLYQLEHSQVPQFRALFTETVDQDQRLFLVQDYVPGETYRARLRQRLQQGQPFSEAEVRQLLAQLLPVLAYIHQQGIIHRDISLDNLMVRSPDQTPVLIDFGVVKTVVTQLQQTHLMPTGTVVGKFGYAPIEQLQSGRAYPSSDLYSLAVCCLVLLTGLEPAQLFDDAAAVWNWRRHATVSDGFAAVLDRMLAHKPSDRYASAKEALQALKQTPVQDSRADSAQTTPLKGAAAPAEEISQIRTMAVGQPAILRDERPRQKGPVIPSVRAVRPAASRPSSQRSKSNVGLLVLVGLVTAVLSAGAGWLAVQSFLQRTWVSQKPAVLSSPTPLETRSPEPTSTIRYSEALQLASGQSVTAQGRLEPQETQTYRFEGVQGDVLSAQISGVDLTFSVLQSDLTPLSPAAIANWQGNLTRTGSYYVRVQNRSGTAQSFQLTLALSKPAQPEPSLTPSPEPIPSPSSSPSSIEPTIDETALSLEPDQPTQEVSGQLAPAHVQRYTVELKAGQSLSAAVVGQSAVTLTIRDPSGQSLAQNAMNWVSLLQEPGSYQVEVVPIDASVATDFAIAVGIQQP